MRCQPVESHSEQPTDETGTVFYREEDKGMAQKPEEKNNVSRRDFIRKSAAVAAGAAAASSAAKKAEASVVKNILPSSVLGANEKIRTGHIGTGGMGRAHLNFLLRRTMQMKKEDIEIIALCDLYPKNLERGAQMADHAFKNFTQHTDFREVIENKDVDAVVIAVPDHWHCLCTLYAADAKKDIYCEKPLSTTIEEGRAMVNGVRKNKVIFQAGTMQRSGEYFQEAVELVKSGYIGKVAHVETYNHESTNLEGIGMGDDDLSKYPGCNWEFHQGWVEHKPFNTNRWIYNFRWFLEYSGGKITDWGAHLIDIGLWAMGEEKQPKSVVATGNKFLIQDNRTTPDTLECAWEYEDYILTFSNRVYNQFLPEGFSDHGILFHGTQGTLRVDRGGYEVYSIPNNGGCEPKKQAGNADMLNLNHWDNFVEAIRERKDPICPVEVIHNTTRTCHMGTCSYVANGAKLGWNAENEKFTGGDAEAVKTANNWAYREYRNGWSMEAPYDRRNA
jgi:predicted dehydrogenase